MKGILLAIISLVLIPGVLAAQRKDSQPPSRPANPATEGRYASRLLTFGQLDQRKIYNWGNGQRSTPTGRQADEEVNKYYVRVFGDSAIVTKKMIGDKKQ